MTVIENFEESLKMSAGNNISRRQFLSGAAATAAFTIVPRHVLGGTGHTPPSEKLSIAVIGVGGRGGDNLRELETENIVALCDVDDGRAAEAFNRCPNAKKYRDFRRMLEKEKNIDAVVISTPDHLHAVAAMMALKLGKHLYCEKPLTHNIYEARKITEAAREAKVATQMGNQGHSGEGIRLICEWIWDGAIGPVREAHAWTNRPTWPQGMERPKEMPPVPKGLDWDLWLGPAIFRPYHPAYLPFSWRAWCDFGTGALGDMGCHIFDAPFWALKLGFPESVEGCSSNLVRTDWDDKPNIETYPRASLIRYKFPAREGMPPVELIWYDGGLKPARPEEGRKMGAWSGGLLFVGDKGKIIADHGGDSPRIIPEAKMRAYKQPPKTIPRVPDGRGGHKQDWVRACKGGEPASSNFDYSGPLTEAVLLGNLAIRAKDKLYWDGPNMKVTNIPEANEFVHRRYRHGWTL
jgi:predicted dehydrogenase